MTFPGNINRDNLHAVLLEVENIAGKELFLRDMYGCIVMNMVSLPDGNRLDFYTVFVIEKDYELELINAKTNRT